MEIVRLAYCDHIFKGMYKLVNIDDIYCWKKIQQNQCGNLDKIPPLYISNKNNRYLAFCTGAHTIIFEKSDL